jgi:glycogen debranching enzyme
VDGVQISVSAEVENDKEASRDGLSAGVKSQQVDREVDQPADVWSLYDTRVKTSNVLFDRILRRSLLDLRLLRSNLGGRHFIAAGIPWYVTLFGRDSLIAALELLPYATSIARETLQLAAAMQATGYDPYRDAEPGKIVHEYRHGVLARLGDIPQSLAYYGSVDSTLLFLILLAQYVRWTGDVAFAEELKGHIDAALFWSTELADHDGDGFLDYSGTYKNGLVNQGWKDSGNTIVNADGSLLWLPAPPDWRRAGPLSRRL